MTPEKIRCDACPVMCFIADGKSGACDRYGNQNGEIIRLDPLIILNSQIEKGKKLIFISQEIGREINTIGSKSNNLQMQQAVVEMKNELEKIKEQLLNVL